MLRDCGISWISSFYADFVFNEDSSSWCLGRAADCDCGTPWTFLLPFLVIYAFGVLKAIPLYFIIQVIILV